MFDHCAWQTKKVAAGTIQQEYRLSMIARTLLIVVLITVAACSGGRTVEPPGTPANSAANQTGGPSGSAVARGAPGVQPLPAGFRQSGALVRVANLYRGSVAAPGPVDVYGNYGTGVDDTPLVIVPYGTMSDWFDPGILDDQRNAKITFFPHGVHGYGDEIASQGETLKGDERISIFLAAADKKNASGQFFGRWRVVFETSAINPMPSPPAGQAAVILDLLTLTDVPGAKDGYVFLSAGGDCITNLSGGNDGPQPMSAGTTAPFAIPAGPRVLTFHPESTDCHGPGLYDGIPVNLDAGKRAFLLLFSPDGKAMRSLLVPIKPYADGSERDDQGRAPLPPRLGEQHPKQSISRAELRRRTPDA